MALSNSTTNTTLGCDSFSSLTDLLNQVQGGAVNLTLEIQQCPSLCEMAWGAGNPDLSGVGATTSWIFQATLTVIFGPLLSAICFWSSRESRLHLEDLHRQFYYANSLVVIPNLIAAIVYLRQNPPLYEVTYIYYLATMQLLSLLGSCLCGLVFLFYKTQEEKEGDDGPDRDTPSEASKRETVKFQLAAIVGTILAFGLYMGSVTWARRASLSLFDVQLLRSDCSAYGTLIPDIPSPPPAVAPPHPLPDDVVLPPSELARQLGIAFGVLAAALLVFLAAGFCCASDGFSRLLNGLFKYAFLAFAVGLSYPWSNCLVCLGFVAGMFFCLGHMQANRDVIKTLAGPDFEDNKWGFGQVVAVFIWIPSSMNAGYWLLRLLMSHPFGGTKKTPDEEHGVTGPDTEAKTKATTEATPETTTEAKKGPKTGAKDRGKTGSKDGGKDRGQDGGGNR